MAFLISDNIDFKTKYITKHNKGHLMMMKGSIHLGNIITKNVYTSIKELQNT